MIPRLFSSNLRWRLTFWYGVVFTLILLLHVAISSFVLYRELVAQTFHDEINDLKSVEGLIYQDTAGRIQIHEDYFNHPQVRLTLEHMIQVMDQNGAILYRNSRLEDERLGGPLTASEMGDGYHRSFVKLSDGRVVLMVSHVHTMGGKTLLLRLGYEGSSIYGGVQAFVLVLLALTPLSIALTCFVIYRVTSSALAPLSIMVKRMRRINAEKLQDRLPVYHQEDDLGQAAMEFNNMLQRIDESFHQLRRFTSDASHELRTPLSSMRSIAEVCLHSTKTPAEYEETLASILEEIRRLSQMVDALFVIARNDSGQVIPEIELVHGMPILQNICEMLSILAEDNLQVLEIVPGADVMFYADRSMLQQALVNVLDNAMKYSPHGSRIEVELVQLPGFAEIQIRDQGPGIPETERKAIFERFRRLDHGRSREQGGSGLGLSIAKWAISSCGGEIGVRASQSGGSCFYMRLPLTLASAEASDLN
jgi:heavy metal sensor kinase